MNWRMVVEEKKLEIIEDEATSEKCYDFWTCTPNYSGYGVVSTTRELCLKKILRQYKKEILKNEKELNIKKRNFKKLEVNI